MTLTDYEKDRLERIAKNKAILAALDIPKAINPTPKRVSKPPAPKKRKRRESDIVGDTSVDVSDRPPLARRCSARLQNIPRRTYDDSEDERSTRIKAKNADSEFGSGDEASEADEDEQSDDAFSEDENGERKPKKPRLSTAPGLARRIVNGRNVAHISKSFDRPNPKTFGSIPGVHNGKWWSTRMEASRDGCHAPTVAGISGNEKDGCWSIALSGGYEDDVDEGYCFTYTGSGGRDLKGTKTNPKNLRTAPQSADQTLTGLNLALKVSCDTGKPVRVIRGFKGHSKWAPQEGYRYDGLYKVVKHWAEKGMAGFLVMKYAFVRIEGQEDIRLDIRTAEDADNIEN